MTEKGAYPPLVIGGPSAAAAGRKKNIFKYTVDVPFLTFLPFSLPSPERPLSVPSFPSPLALYSAFPGLPKCSLSTPWVRRPRYPLGISQRRQIGSSFNLLEMSVHTEYVEHVNDATAGIPPVPPGFSLLTSFTLKRLHNDDVIVSANASGTVQHALPDEKLRKSLRYRPWVNYSEFINCTDEEFEREHFEQNVPPSPCLPKGVLRGCSECQTCQKVTTRWRPRDACKLTLDDAPVFHPSEEEFNNILEYIASIRPSAEKYGICKIIPPSSWRPACLLKEKKLWKDIKFSTSIQQVDKLQNRNSSMIKGNHSISRNKRQKLLTSNVNMLETHRLRYHNSSERFGFEPGPDFTLEAFQKYADNFKEQYFHHSNIDKAWSQKELSVENIEGEYWRIIERPTEQIEVLCGAHLDSGILFNDSPEVSSCLQNFEFQDHFNWNLNNIAHLPGSVLSFESGQIPGVLVPWIYIGMCFSSFCWHVEDHHLYSLNYMHWGAPKVWYGVPGKYALKFEEAMKKHLPDLFDEQPDLLHNLVTQFSPSLLMLEGVPVHRCVQYSGEFILTFPRAYHSGFSCGFNCTEAVNVAPLDWLPYGQNAVQLYHEQGRDTSISHDKLLLGAAREVVRFQWSKSFSRESTSGEERWKKICGSDGILAKALEARIKIERIRREYLCSPQSQKMDADFDAIVERECFLCHYDLHLSAASCPCSPDRFACLIHAKYLCSCSWSTRIFLFRYDISELNVLLDALKGKLSAVHRWGKLDLGLSLSSYTSKEKTDKSKFLVTINEEAKRHNDNKKEPCVRMDRNFQALVHRSTNKASLSNYQQVEGMGPPHKNTDIVSHNSSNFISLDDDPILVSSRRILSNKEGERLKSSTRVTAAESGSDALPAKEASHCSSSSHLQIPQDSGRGKANVDSKDGKTESNSRYVPDTENCAPKSFSNQQDEGSQLENVVQRINRNVEVLSYGGILSGKLWYISQVIFPKGYKSRVKYLSILDPTKMCYYISEILDAGLLGPLFMVMVEQCPNEIFIHVSASKCWDMVRERVNLEIGKLLKMGKLDLPSLQPPESVNGLEMFGLSSPSVIQAIEALDPNHVCTEYWRSRSNAPSATLRADHSPSLSTNQFEGDYLQKAASRLAVRRLFKKANPEELHALQNLLNNNLKNQELIHLLNEELNTRPS